MLSVSELNKEEIGFIINIIGVEDIRKFFQDRPRLLQQLSPFRAKSLTAEQMTSLIYKNISSDIIFNYIQGEVERYIKHLDDSIIMIEKEVEDRNKATIIALAESPFRENLSVYYKLIEKNIDDDSIKLLSTIVNSPELVKMLSSEKSDKNLSEQIEQLTKQLNEKDTLIESVNESLLRVQNEEKQKVEDIRKQLADAQTTIASLQSELNTFKAADIIPEEEIDDGYAYHSMCKIYEFNSKLWMTRLADVSKNELIPFLVDISKPPMFGNNTRLRCTTGPTNIGHIGIWAWNFEENYKRPDEDYTHDMYCEKYIPIEIIDLSRRTTIDTIAEYLRNGISIIPSTDKVLFSVQISDEQFRGLLCSHKNYNIENGLLKLKEECYFLDDY